MTRSTMDSAVLAVAARFGWTEMGANDLRLMLWSLFRYYAARAASDREDYVYIGNEDF